MKVATVRTGIWKDEHMQGLIPDARLFYICLLTIPERKESPLIKASDTKMVKYTGFSSSTVNHIKDLLRTKGIIDFIAGYYIVLDELDSLEVESLPIDIPDAVKGRIDTLLKGEEGSVSGAVSISTGEAVSVIAKTSVREGSDSQFEVDYKHLYHYWCERTGRKMSDNKTSRSDARKLLKEHTVAEIERAINGAVYFEDKEYRPVVLSFGSLYSKWDELHGHMQRVIDDVNNKNKNKPKGVVIS